MRKILFFVLFFASLESTFSSPKSDDQLLREESLQSFGIIKSETFPTADSKNSKEYDLFILGKKLYFDKNLSSNGTISCNSCHGLDKYGVDGAKTSTGHTKKTGDRNAPTVYNATYHIAQFWDGRASDLAEQATGPLMNPIEHGLKDEAELVSKLSDAEYISLFKKSFGNDNARNLKNVGIAIAAFEKYLVTPSRFDDFLAGNDKALSNKEKNGLKKFLMMGCNTCHQGIAMGGGQFQKLGLVKEYPTKDFGKFLISKNEDDKFVFKVPSLRNVAKTGPYFHDGSISKLSDAIKLMGRHQLGVELKQKEIREIEAFLGSLTAKELPSFK